MSELRRVFCHHPSVDPEGTNSRLPRAVSHSVRALEDLSWPLGVTVVSVALGLSWVLSYLPGGAGAAPPHWFYVPVLLAAARFGFLGVMVTAPIATLLAGPLLPLDTAADTTQAASDWLGRGGFFLGIGLLMAAVVRALLARLEHEAAVAKAERDLFEQRNALIDRVSHEFRSPLTSLTAALHTLHRSDLDEEERAEFLGVADRAAARLRDLVASVVATLDRSQEPPTDG